MPNHATTIDPPEPIQLGAGLNVETRQRLMATLNRLREIDDMLEGLAVPLFESARRQCDGYAQHDPRHQATIRRHREMIAKLREVRDYCWRAYLEGADEHDPAKRGGA